jgi:uncharacterized RDD family membrane protein YckC
VQTGAAFAFLLLTDSAPMISYEPASFAVRGLALVYEALIVAAILFVAAAIPTAINRAAIAPGTIWFELWLAASVFAYFGYCWTRSGQTVPMRAWQLLLTDLSGRRVSWRTALLRWCVSALLGFGVLGWLAMLVDRDGLALQDRLSKTRVLRLPKSTKLG